MAEAAKGPVFVAGCPRSGTSALSWAIAAHPGYWTSAETHFFYYLLRNGVPTLNEAFELSSEPGQWLHKHGVDQATFMSYLGDLTSAQSALPLLYEIDYGVFLEYIGHGFSRMMRAHSGGLQWVDGSPENSLVGELLLQMFPEASIFILVRDPRAVCFSMLTSGFRAPWASDLDAAIREWTHYARAGKALAAAHPDRVIEIRQEDMRAKPDAVAGLIADRLGLDEPERVAEFLATRTVNSSLDRATYAAESPFALAPETGLSRDEFLARHEAAIMRGTAALARDYGYG
jgi:hypothetical protein